MVLTGSVPLPPDAAFELFTTRMGADGSTVRLEHGGWENLGETGVEARAGYTEGWEPVLDLLVDAAG